VQPLAEKFAAAFKTIHPKVTVTIQGGGSSVGIKSAADGTVDIGAASRELKADEPALVKHLIAKDGVAIIVHPSNNITNLTREQVRDIFSSKLTSWKDLGGPDKEIHVVAREEGSGTRGAFEEMVMEKELITNHAILQSSNGAIRTTVAGDSQAIGFLSLGYIDSSVKALAIGGIPCTTSTALDGTYPIVRPLYFLTAAEPSGTVKEFLDFCKSADGQSIVEAEGYIPVK
jgi:phosphate transport system substrate-binding protein